MSEPFQKLINQGMVLGEMEITGYQNPQRAWVSAAAVDDGPDGKPILKASGETVTAVRVPAEQAEKKGESFVLSAQPDIRLESRSYKMSKSRGNVINPNAVVEEYGADSLRLFEMFMGPLEATKPWSMTGVSGVRGFLDRVWRMIVDERSEVVVLSASVQPIEPTADDQRVIHRTIQGVTQDIERLSFNTAIAKMMEFTNYFFKREPRPRVAMETLTLLLAPFAPHLAEELWSLLGHDKTLAYEPWPTFDESMIREDHVEIPVQISGKLRGRVVVPVGTSPADLEAAARAEPRVAELLEGVNVVKVIAVPGRMINFVVK
jgi:leucyl-tRNA synthetase